MLDLADTGASACPPAALLAGLPVRPRGSTESEQWGRGEVEVATGSRILVDGGP